MGSSRARWPELTLALMGMINVYSNVSYSERD